MASKRAQMRIPKQAVATSLALSLMASAFPMPDGYAQATGKSPPGSPFQPWINGLHDEPQMQVQQYDADTFVIRQSIRTNFEAPFIFLFLGPERALLIDTGAGGLLIRPTIDKVIADWTASKGTPELPLLVAHSHAHGDHIAGDSEFADRPNTTVVGHSPEAVASFFHIEHWPEDTASINLGGREIDIIPMPGHEPAEIALFDRRTRLLLTGDALYPGRLYVRADAEFDAYRTSIDRVANYTRDLHVSWILGNHIEMTRTPGRDYAMHIPIHPDEHVLQLPYSALLELEKSVDAMGNEPRLDIHRDFILYPRP
jgi:glyoxylase-like metal-dependent hydrolase (beta-lactamase superfamily II)